MSEHSKTIFRMKLRSVAGGGPPSQCKHRKRASRSQASGQRLAGRKNRWLSEKQITTVVRIEGVHQNDSKLEVRCSHRTNTCPKKPTSVDNSGRLFLRLPTFSSSCFLLTWIRPRTGVVRSFDFWIRCLLVTINFFSKVCNEDVGRQSLRLFVTVHAR